MKEQLIKWMPVLALVSFVAAVFLISDGHFWAGIVWIAAGAGLSSAAAVSKKKSNAAKENRDTK